MKSDASLKGKIKALAKQSGLKPQELLQMYLFEHLLIRLERSDYAETFVLKGGLLISSMTGVSQRATMDMDAAVVGMDMDEATVGKAVIATASRRGSLRKMAGYEAVLEEVKGSSVMRGTWAAYVSGSPYAAGIDFEEAVDSALRLARLSGLDELV